MPRPHRIDYDGAVHHVMNRGVNHQAIFFGDSDRVLFGSLLADVHVRFGVEVLAYCLMGNHFHLLVRTPTAGLSDAMHRLASLFSRRVNDRIGRDGPLFRSRFASYLVTTDRYLLAATRYLHRNALDVRGVRHIDAYRWSSYLTYMGRRPCPPFVRTDLVLDLFGRRLDAFEQFHSSDDAAALGFADTTRHGLDDVVQLVEFAIAEDDLLHGSDEENPTPWLRRTLHLLLVDWYQEASWWDDLVADFAFPSPSARRMALQRARRRWATDITVQRVAGRIVGLLAPTAHAA